MPNDLRITAAVAKVVAAFLTDPAADRYGLDLIRTTALPSGTLYPVLVRLERAGWLTKAWEEIDPTVAGRPARRYYRLTPDGIVDGRRELAALHQQIAAAGGTIGAVRPA
jgi:PadR family transcriptional regulator, regulatory protein PadR